MSASQPRRQRTALSDDGELHDIPDMPEQSAPIYCTNCGTANRSNSQFCRSCGVSLDDPDLDGLYVAPQAKHKRDAAVLVSPQRARFTGASVAVEIVTLICVAGMVSTTARYNSTMLSFVILVAWVLVEAIRHGAIGRK
jgi:hypothetical protein